MNIAYPPASRDRRVTGLVLTGLVHVALLLGWQMAEHLPKAQDSAERSSILWLPAPQAPQRADKAPPPARDIPVRRPRDLPPPALPRPLETAPQPEKPVAEPGTANPAQAAAAPEAAAITVFPGSPATGSATAQASTPGTGRERILDAAKRDIGKIDKALRKENRPYIAAPLDSPQIRLRAGIEQAAALARPGLFEAPKVEELVNNTGDGARRSRVITGNGTYCVTERATNTDVEMIEHHGKTRITNCPTHETPAKQQTWRTLRD